MSEPIMEKSPTPHTHSASALTQISSWARKNLFSSPLNTILTLFALYLIWLIFIPAIDWALLDAVWYGDNTSCAANPEVACWPFISERLGFFFYGFYEKSELWRVDLVCAVLVIGLGALIYEKTPGRKYIGLFMLIGYPILAWVFLYGGLFGLQVVETNQWGGFFLTLVIALTGIVLSLPFGILLALGRRSTNMPIIQTFCIIFIEFWRGVPLITVLFMASVMLPLFLPPGVTMDQLLRALIGVALFSSAYMAEVVRGGLQAIPKGQFEGAMSLGLPYWRTMRLIILPQALKIVIPGIVNTFIGLFKDTTLVLIIGLFDLLGTVQAASTDPNWSIKSVPYTGYVFVALVFFICCYGMSLYSRYIETKLNTGHKR